MVCAVYYPKIITAGTAALPPATVLADGSEVRLGFATAMYPAK